MRDYIHKNEALCYICPFYVGYGKESKCKNIIKQHNILYVLSCRNDTFYWEVIGDLIKFKYKKVKNKWISQIDKIPSQIDPELLKYYGKKKLPGYKLYIKSNQ